MGKYVAPRMTQPEIDEASLDGDVEDMMLDADVLYPMPLPAHARNIWKGTPAGRAIVEPLMVARDDPLLYLYAEQQGRFNSADKGMVGDMGIVTFEHDRLDTCSTVYQEKRVVKHSPLSCVIGEAPATNLTTLSTFDICVDHGTKALAENNIGCSCARSTPRTPATSPSSTRATPAASVLRA